MNVIKLTAMQARFVEEYLKDYDAAGAAERAGFADNKEGWRLLRKPHVKEAIQSRSRVILERLGVDKSYIIAKLVDVIQVAEANVKPKLNSKTGKPLKDEDGNPIYVRDNMVILRALDQLAKHVDIGAYKNEMDININDEREIINKILGDRPGRGNVKDDTIH